VDEKRLDHVPDFAFRDLDSETFRRALLTQGAVMLRQACGPALLRDFRQRLDELFAKCAALSEAEFTRLFHDGDATEQGLWERPSAVISTIERLRHMPIALTSTR
jgi:hypothetical protein